MRTLAPHLMGRHGITVPEYRLRFPGAPHLSAEMHAIKCDLALDRGIVRYWNETRIVAALQRWARLHGSPPSAVDWNRPGRKKARAFGERTRTWPATTQVQGVFGSWNAAMKAAGFAAREFRAEPKAACKNGHPRTAENTYTSPAGDRQCRVCNRERDRQRDSGAIYLRRREYFAAYYQRKKAA